MQTTVNDVIRTAVAEVKHFGGLVAATAERLGPAQARALVLAVLVVCLAATPISLGAANNQQSTGVTGLAPATAPVDRSDNAPSRASSRAVPARKVPPVAQLSQRQMDHAATIVATGKKMGLPERAYVVAVATAMQESNLRNLANTRLPASLNLPNDGTGFDHDSVGLFQQRPASGWGPVDQLMDPPTSAGKFYQALEQVPGWQDMPVTVAAQSVQGSAFPDAYAKHQGRAEAVVDAITKQAH